ncbi:hypothetical protein B0I37DRAFT_410622 [Chaetomium sp. MPI-CAGE-AT-0009]|nr:hypothetical protein B0I37DRAFT_410622 [Chaetomium sp. MPI-CAGE-AT-0009]
MVSSNTTYTALPFWLVRRNHDATHAPRASQNADAIVVGGGAAGIAVVGNLLETIPRGKIVWIDRSFDGGSIGQLYREAPSYSPAGDFLRYAQALKTFRDICDAAPKPNIMDTLQDLDPETTCPLNHAADMLTLISDGLIQHPRVEPVLGTVTHAVRNPKTRHWKTTLTPNHDIGTITPHPQHHPQQQQQQQHPQAPQHPPQNSQDSQQQHHTAPLLIYCTGTRPKTTDLPLPISRLTLDTCLSPTRLSRILATDRPRTVAVVGSGHAAVLALRNLYDLATGGSHPLLRASRFARGMLEGERLVESGAGEFITRFVIPPCPVKGVSEVERAVWEGEAMRKDLEGVDYVVEDAGFVRGRLPEVRPGLGALQGPVGKPKNLVFDALTGSFYPSGSRDQVLGLFGAGSAFPELDRSVAGRQPAVGVWKFMRSAQRLVPRWVQAMKRGPPVKMEERDWELRRKRFREYY